MAKIPVNDPIHAAVEGGKIICEHRPYLGYSGLGHSCNRYLWYSFHWCYDKVITQKQQRLFSRGHNEEPIIIKDLSRAGLFVHSTQIEIVDDTGHARGHIDGMVEDEADIAEPLLGDEVCLLEMKTMNEANFKKFKQKGLKVAFPVYYAQIESYMGKLDLKKCLYVITNKNTDERIYKLISYDNTHEDLDRKAFNIIVAEEPPEKIGEATWFECKFCDARNICHKDAPANENCRTCEHGTIENDGKWSCGSNGEEIDTARQRTGCSLYKKMSVL